MTWKPLDPTEVGAGQLIGRTRDDMGDGHGELRCDNCGATWVGLIGEECGWCLNHVVTGTDTSDPADNLDGDWARHDLTDIVEGLRDGTYQPEMPEHLHVDGGLPLLYPGRVHSIFGEPGGGKTWLSYVAVAERLRAGEHVLYIDWEDSPRGAAQRLMQLGVTAEELERFDYRNPTTGLPTGWATIGDTVTDYALVVIDSTGESMAASGVDPNADGQVAMWVAYAKRLARGGATVILVDHVAKNVDNRDMEIGSQRKQAAITGASYRCDTLISPAKGKDGKLKLVVRKDRLGTRAKGSTACEVDIHDVDDGCISITLHISETQAATERGEKFRPTHLMERVSRWLEVHPRSSRRTIEDEVTGKSTAIRTAIDVLVEEGFVRFELVNRTHEHTVITPFREGEDAHLVIHRPPSASHASPRVPHASHASGDAADLARVPRVPVRLEDGTRDAPNGLEDTSSASPTLRLVDNSEPTIDQF